MTPEDRLVEALEAWAKYDTAIFIRASSPEDLVLDPLGAVAGGEDLDRLYFDAKTLMDEALAEYKASKGEAQSKCTRGGKVK
jgi:hypothetical protein